MHRLLYSRNCVFLALPPVPGRLRHPAGFSLQARNAPHQSQIPKPKATHTWTVRQLQARTLSHPKCVSANWTYFEIPQPLRRLHHALLSALDPREDELRPGPIPKESRMSWGLTKIRLTIPRLTC